MNVTNLSHVLTSLTAKKPLHFEAAFCFCAVQIFYRLFTLIICLFQTPVIEPNSRNDAISTFR